MDIGLGMKEGEAICWITAELIDYADKPNDQLDESSIILRLRAMGFTNAEIRAEGQMLEDLVAKRVLPTALTVIQTEALREAVERTTWIECYAEDNAKVSGPEGLAEALEAIRQLAVKLEERGVEVVQLAYGEYGQV